MAERQGAAGGGISPVFHHPCPQPPLSRQKCITRRCPLPPPHTQRGTALLERQISDCLPANNPSGSPSARPCKQAPFPVSGALSEGQDGLQTGVTAGSAIRPRAGAFWGCLQKVTLSEHTPSQHLILPFLQPPTSGEGSHNPGTLNPRTSSSCSPRGWASSGSRAGRRLWRVP